MPSPLYVRCQLAYMVNSIIMEKEEQKVPSGMLFLCVWESMFCFSSILAWPQINWIKNEWGKKSIEMGEWTALSSVSILLLFIRPSLQFLTDKCIWTDKLPKLLTPLHSKTPKSEKVGCQRCPFRGSWLFYFNLQLTIENHQKKVKC